MNTREGYAELQTRILDARRVWKRSIFWAGFAIVLTGIIAVFVGEAIVDWLMPLPSFVRIALLTGGVGVTAYLLYKYLVQPLRAALTLRDVALNVEQNHPDLEDRLVSAIEFGNRESTDPIEAHMLQRLLEDTTQRVESIDFKATVDHSRTRKHAGIAALVVVGCCVLALLFPTELHTSLLRVLVPWEKTEPVLTTKVTVEPGNVRILRGKSLPIHVTVTGKSTDKVVLTYENIEQQETDPSETQTTQQQVNMLQNPDDKRGFAYEIFNIDADIEYYVIANETTSERYTVEVFEMPKVTEISVAYTYPEYTGLKPVVQTGTGDIQAVVGTQAEIRLTTNKAIQTATFTLRRDVKQKESDETQEPASTQMVISDGNILTTTVDVIADGTYTVELLGIDGFNNEIPIEYTIKAIPDAIPEIVIKEPGRDIKTTKLGEVEIIAEATDDYGVAELKLMYRIGSDELQELTLETSTPDAVIESGAVDTVQRRVAEGSYTFYLEEFDVEPGDIISYYAHAVDNNTHTGPGEASSDIYFIEIRPFNENFQESEAEQGPPMPNPLLEILASQKQIIRETAKHISAKPASITDEYRNAVKKTGEKQSQLRDKTQRLADEFSMAMQGESAVTPEILMNLEDAIEKMREAADSLNAVQPAEAIPLEQEALELLIKVSLELPKILRQMRNSNPQLAENLELEMEELQSELENQQNELDQEMQEQTQEMLDQARQMLAEQQQLSQQSQQLGRESEPSPSEMQENSQQQGQLSQQAQQMAEQLGTMQQDAQGSQQGQRLDQAGQAMQQAGEQMQQAAQGMQQQEPQLSAAKGQKAEERLEQAIEQLEKVASEFSDAALANAEKQVQEMIEEQSGVQQETQELRNRSQQSEMRPEDFRKATELANEQRELQRDLGALENTLENLPEQLAEENPEAAQNVRDATRRLTEEQTAGDMSTAQRALQWRSFRAAELNQQEVVETLRQVQADLQQAQANMANTEEEQLETALQQLQRARQQMQDIQRELQAMEGQEQTEEQQQRQQQLAEQQQQIQEQMQQAQQAMQNRQDGQQPGQQPGQNDQEGQQPGQDGQAEGDNQEARTGGRESGREINELWLGLLDTMDYQPGNRSNPFPNYEFVIRDLTKLEAAIEERLNTLQEKKQLTQVAKEDVPPEYRRLVDNYYESLSQ
ncbi:hypothetical protein C6503_22640 [Candidatus Poribacteria bacterium]|nr:MAG: hypothetical protein C6503_22640 [Candidatus Poribacteria bacterium]